MSALDWIKVTRDDRFAPLRGQTTLVTGGAGFIGSHLVDALLALDCRVTVLDNLATGRPSNLAHLLTPEGLAGLEEWRAATTGRRPWAHRILEVRSGGHTFVRVALGDLRDPETCRAACDRARYVFHQAALGSVPRSMEHPAETLDVNVSGTARLFEAARDAKASRIVYASSSSVYGDSTALPKREGEEGRPLSPYAASKVMNEELAGVFGRCFAREFVGLRYFNVYGPRQDPDGPYAAVVPRFFQAYLCGKAPVIYGDGAQSRDFTYVADAVMANLLAAIAPTEACGQAYNVAPGKRTTINELAAMVREATGSGPLPAHESPRAGDVRDSNADPAAAHTALGFVATTSLAAGLRMACPFYELLKDPHGTAAQEG